MCAARAEGPDGLLGTAANKLKVALSDHLVVVEISREAHPTPKTLQCMSDVYISHGRSLDRADYIHSGSDQGFQDLPYLPVHVGVEDGAVGVHRIHDLLIERTREDLVAAGVHEWGSGVLGPVHPEVFDTHFCCPGHEANDPLIHGLDQMQYPVPLLHRVDVEGHGLEPSRGQVYGAGNADLDDAVFPQKG